MTTATLASVHQQFEAALPAIHRSARYALRRRRHDRDDLLAEVIACAWKAWRGLADRGKSPLVVGVTAITNWAARHALKGRRIGNRTCGRGAMDVFHHRAQKIAGFRVNSYDSGPATPTGSKHAAWEEGLAADRHFSPADEACFRLDFAAWLARLPARRRRTAELLAEGYGTLEVAHRVGVTPAAVSQARAGLARDWREFQGEVPAVGVRSPHPPGRRPHGNGDVRVRS
jgi:DNA-directed RNA polymerase specialized sigma24 family protein